MILPPEMRLYSQKSGINNSWDLTTRNMVSPQGSLAVSLAVISTHLGKTYLRRHEKAYDSINDYSCGIIHGIPSIGIVKTFLITIFWLLKVSQLRLPTSSPQNEGVSAVQPLLTYIHTYIHLYSSNNTIYI